MTARILQFGTSRFLQAHVDLFVHEARLAGQDIGPVTVVKTTRGNERANRVNALGAAGGFPVRLRGFKNGQLVDETVQVTSVTQAFDANVDWVRVKDIFAHETEIVVSNVGETGYDLGPEDCIVSPDSVPQSFPAKLHTLLLHRFKKGAKPLTILPCELVINNGQVLYKTILCLSEEALDSDAFRTWLAGHVLFCDTLVDRIVSEAIDPVGAIGEPYGLWAIKRQLGLQPPLQHPCVVYTDDLEPYLRLKLHILNLGHTFLAEIWKVENWPKEETVREILEEKAVKSRLLALYHDEIIPGFAARKMGTQALDYTKTTIERFENPFLNHRLSDIAQNHRYKIERRMVDFIKWVREQKSTLRFETLEAIIAKSGG